jgi:hypothetical protein
VHSNLGEALSAALRRCRRLDDHYLGSDWDKKYDRTKSRAAEEAGRAGTAATTPHVTTSKQASKQACESMGERSLETRSGPGSVTGISVSICLIELNRNRTRLWRLESDVFSWSRGEELVNRGTES